MSSPSSSPAFLKVVLILVSLFIYPLLCAKWVVSSLARGKPVDASVFFFIGTFGATMLCLFFLVPEIKDSFVWRPVIGLFYSAGLVATIALIRSIKDESHGTYVR